MSQPTVVTASCSGTLVTLHNYAAPISLVRSITCPCSNNRPTSLSTERLRQPESVPSNANQPSSESDQFVSTEDYRRYSTRNKKPPDLLDYDYLGG